MSNNRYLSSNKRLGFTIVELIVVIVVIGIITAIITIGYGSWRSAATIAQVKSDLNGAAAAMESARNFNDGYPSSLPSSFSASEGVSLSGGSYDDGLTYCIDGTSSSNSDIKYYIDSLSNNKTPTEGVCADRPIPPDIPGSLAVTGTTYKTIDLSWGISPYAVGYDVLCSTDLAQHNNVVQDSIDNVETLSKLFDNLKPQTLYYCFIRSYNESMHSAWSVATTTTTSTVPFGTIAAATNLRETSVGPLSSNLAWDGISCDVGSPQYRRAWVSPTTGASSSWVSDLNMTVDNTQASQYNWKIETKCVYDGIDSDIASSSTKQFTSTVAAPTGSFGSISWDGRWAFSASSNTFACTSPAALEFTIVKTLNNETSGTWTYSWSGSSSQTVSSDTNQGAKITTYLKARCYYNSISSTEISSTPRTDIASITAPGAIPGWTHTGSPKGERWSAVTCPTGTYGVYYAYAYGDYSNTIWGPYTAAAFYGYDRPSYTYGNTMVNSEIQARCDSAYTSSPWGPKSTARY